MSFQFRLILFLAIAAVCLLSIPFPHFLLWLIGIYPAPTGTPPTYQLWSGFVPAAAIVGVIWPFVNCHVEGCPRYGKYSVEGFKVCHLHHPSDEVGGRGVTPEHILHLHRKHRGMLG